MQYITRQEAHLKSRFLNESLEGYTILDEEISHYDEVFVLINDKKVIVENVIPYAKKDDVITLINYGYDKKLLNNYELYQNIYKEHFAKQLENSRKLINEEIEKKANKENIIINEGIKDILLDVLQGALGVVGVGGDAFAGAGAIADGANVVISILRGEYIMAALNAISMIPVAGDAVGKTGAIIGKALQYFAKLSKFDDIIKIGANLLKGSKFMSFIKPYIPKIYKFILEAEKFIAGGKFNKFFDYIASKPIVGKFGTKMKDAVLGFISMLKGVFKGDASSFVHGARDIASAHRAGSASQVVRQAAGREALRRVTDDALPAAAMYNK